MKYLVKIVIIPLVLLTAGSLSLVAQRGIRGVRPDSSRLRKPALEMMKRTDSVRPGMTDRDFWRMRMRAMPPYRLPMHGMHRSFRYYRRPGAYFWGPAPGMRFRGMDDFPSMRRNMPGIRALNNIPGLTDDQKRKIDELLQQQRSEMQKLREDMNDEIKELRGSHRSKLRDLLTDEQKEWFDKNSPQPLEK